MMQIYIVLIHLLLLISASIYERIDSNQHSIVKTIAVLEVESQLQCVQKCFRLKADIKYEKGFCHCVVFDETINKDLNKKKWTSGSSFMMMGGIQKLKPTQKPIITVPPTTPTTTTPAPIDGQWTEWGEWKILVEVCPNICIATPQEKRKRECTNPKPLHGGKKCRGRGSETNRCPVDECQVEVCRNYKTGLICDELIGTLTCDHPAAQGNCSIRCGNCGRGTCRDIKSHDWCSANSGNCDRSSVARLCRSTCNHCIPGDIPDKTTPEASSSLVITNAVSAVSATPSESTTSSLATSAVPSPATTGVPELI